jgi:hypothetical protein
MTATGHNPTNDDIVHPFIQPPPSYSGAAAAAVGSEEGSGT